MAHFSVVRAFFARRPDRGGGSPLRDAKAAVREVAASAGPILAGPWLSEVGHELLYWLPFLHWACEREPALSERLIVVSRGGVSSWYAGVAAAGYCDVYDVADAAEVQRHIVDVGARKRMHALPFDAELVSRVEGHLGLQSAASLHPAAMFQPYWRLLKEGGVARHKGMFEVRPLASPPVPPELEARLPDRFVAVRFYFNASFPETDDNRATVLRLLEALAGETAVVALDPGRQFDDHWDVELDGRAVRIDDLATPATNLGLQTAVLSRADAYVGTYGGLSYLAPLLGVPSIAVYSDPARFRPHHLEHAQRAFRRDPFGNLLALDVKDLVLLRLVAGLERRSARSG